MNNPFSKIYFALKNMKNKLAFFPTVMALWGIVFGFIMIYAEQAGISIYLQKYLPALVINDLETARTILSTFIAGLISILVFSFSMVMILLNQAASNFSPRLLPGLISNKKHQSILGIYLSGIFYCLMVLISIEPSQSDYQLPGFSVLLGIFIMTVSLAAFIYFVHSISQSIQVDNILKSIFIRAENRLKQPDHEHVSDHEKQFNDFKNSSEWSPYYTERTGFIQTFNQQELCNLCHQLDTKIMIAPNKNTFILNQLPLFHSSRELTVEQADAILEQIIIDDVEPLDDNYVLSFKLIIEIAVKAMSPGINDPGTAASCIDYMTQLLSLRMRKSDRYYIFDNNEAMVKLNNISFEKLIYNIFAPLRAYCSHDVILVKKILYCINYLLSLPCEFDSYKSNLIDQAELIINDANQELDNQQDLAVIDEMAERIKSHKKTSA